MRRHLAKFFAGLAGLTYVPVVFSTPQQARPDLPVNHQPVPIVRQATDYSCGAALMAVLQYLKVYEDGEINLHLELNTTEKDGTHPESIVAYAKKLGLSAHFRENVEVSDLRRALANGQSVILDLQAWRSNPEIPWEATWEDGHYIVLVGLDDHYLYAMDPVLGTSYSHILLSELKARWHDYEERNGKVWRNYQLAIFISSPDKALPQFPHKLQRIE